MDGSIKDAKGWQNVIDIDANRTGGGEPLQNELTALEERLLGVLPSEQMDGIECAKGGFVTDTAPNMLEERAIRISDEVISETPEHPTCSIDFEHSVLNKYSQLPGPSTGNNVVSSPEQLPPLILASARETTSPAHPTASSDLTSQEILPPPTSRLQTLPPTPLETNRSRRPRTSRAAQLYRTSLTQNSQKGLALQEQALKELRRTNDLNREMLEFMKEERIEKNRWHEEITSLLKENTFLLKEIRDNQN